MVHSFKKTALLCNALVFAALACFAQDVEPPFTWKGDGSASLVNQDGSTDFTFQFELSVDAQGRVSGTSSNEEGSSTIKHVFYTQMPLSRILETGSSPVD